jgi:hypothetical protein
LAENKLEFNLFLFYLKLHLGLFENAVGNTELGLRFMRHAMYYWEIIYGPLHPDGATADVKY